MEENKLTDEQTAKIQQLRKTMLRRSAMNGAKFCGCLLLANLLVSVINIFFVQNDSFQFVGSMVSFIILFGSFSQQAERDRDKLKEELDKIFR